MQDMQWEIKDWIISKLYIDNKNIISPFWFETSDSYSFYSQETKWNRCKENKYISAVSNNSLTNKINVTMREWSRNLSIYEELLPNSLIREHTLKTNEDTYIFDYVQRYVFDKNEFHKAFIAWKNLTHTNSNIYYQYQTNLVTLHSSTYSLNISLLNYKWEQFVPHMYVRDTGEEWIVHVRLMPKKRDKEVIKLCTFWYNKSIPQWISNILLKHKWIRNFLWLKWEKKPWKTPFWIIAPNAYPQVLVKKWTILHFKSKLTVLWKKN